MRRQSYSSLFLFLKSLVELVAVAAAGGRRRGFTHGPNSLCCRMKTRILLGFQAIWEVTVETRMPWQLWPGLPRKPASPWRLLHSGLYLRHPKRSTLHLWWLRVRECAPSPCLTCAPIMRRQQSAGLSVYIYAVHFTCRNQIILIDSIALGLYRL